MIKFKQITKVFRYSKSDAGFIRKIPLTYKKGWDGDLLDLIASGTLPINSDKTRDKIKNTIKSKLDKIQGEYCAFCGLHKTIVGNLQKEHIAPKKHHTEYTFYPKNLALACSYCNSSSKKGSIDTIVFKADKYEDHEFQLLHPYFDDFWEYVEYGFEGASIILKSKNQDFKADAHLELFKLNDLKQAELRGAYVVWDYYRSKLSAKEFKKIERSRKDRFK